MKATGDTTRSEGAFDGIRSVDAIDRAAHHYARYIDPMSRQVATPALRLAPVQDGTTVLDVATGAGALALQAAHQGAHVLATDISPAFIQIVAERAHQAGLRDLTAEVMDGQGLALGDDAFERAYSLLGLMFFEDRARGFREMHRVLEPGGMAVVSTWCAPPDNPFALLQQALMDVAPEVMAGAPPPPGMDLADPERLRHEMEEAGFESVRVETLRHDLPWPGPEEHWHALTTANPMFSPVLQNLDDARVERLHQTVTARVESLRGDDGKCHQTVATNYGVGTKGRA